jgi:hypothetical protein
MLEKKSFRLCWGSSLYGPVVHSVARHYTDWATRLTTYLPTFLFMLTYLPTFVYLSIRLTIQIVQSVHLNRYVSTCLRSLCRDSWPLSRASLFAADTIFWILWRMSSKFLRNLGNLKAVLLCNGLSFVSSNRMRGGEPGNQDRRWTPDGSESLPMGGASCIRRQLSLRRIAPQWRLCFDGGSLRQEVRGPYVAMHVRINVKKMPNTTNTFPFIVYKNAWRWSSGGRGFGKL